ncbi:abortive infection family protein [Photobacterium leiognathi]|uniref:abortive infection family protein n=1 Tax=Photobacterium leiognathi TaxID=553611 RepID=UPI00298282B2|nr:abortive infection family protein [Photobacterium leiognathi]
MYLTRKAQLSVKVSSILLISDNILLISNLHKNGMKMPLELPAELQFATEYPFAIPDNVFKELQTLMGRVNFNERCGEKNLIEIYKKHMAKPAGIDFSRSSNTDWAKGDLEWYMTDASNNGPGFIAAIYNAFEQLSLFEITVPTDAHINQILSRHGIPCHINNGELVMAGNVQVPEPSQSMSQTVIRALQDAKTLMPASAIDRVHTALHAYIVSLCQEANIPLDSGVTAQKAFKELKNNHPALQPQGNRPSEVANVLNSMAATINALGTIRNHASLAHNNELLLEPEAQAMINAAITIFRYIEECMARYNRTTVQSRPELWGGIEWA